jgi:5-methylcytosine-specific restriction enzyme subunit McrC
MGVPVENIYYLLCYAWDRLQARDVIPAGGVPGNRVENLLGMVLQRGVADLVRRGLDRGYLPFEETGRSLRGKVVWTETLNRLLLEQARVACQTDELSHDVPHNRVIKAAMRAVLSLPGLDAGIAAGLREQFRRLQDVSDISLTPDAFRRVQLHRNVARYAFLVNIARLVERSFIPDPHSGSQRFHPFNANEQEMGRVFEAFVRKFLEREQEGLNVDAPKVKWVLDSLESSDPRWLPEMQTDVVLTGPGVRVVIETKYYATPYQERAEGSRKVISEHLYQLLSYLTHLRAKPGPAPVGVLLYAGPGIGESLRYKLDGQSVYIRNLDLSNEWRQIHCDLNALVHELSHVEA